MDPFDHKNKDVWFTAALASGTSALVQRLEGVARISGPVGVATPPIGLYPRVDFGHNPRLARQPGIVARPIVFTRM